MRLCSRWLLAAALLLLAACNADTCALGPAAGAHTPVPQRTNVTTQTLDEQESGSGQLPPEEARKTGHKSRYAMAAS